MFEAVELYGARHVVQLKDFLNFVKHTDANTIAEEALERPFVHAFLEEAEYATYLAPIHADYPSAERIAIMGSGNWKFSLNPSKGFREFNEKSDIDIAIVCRDSFEKTWADLRIFHRQNFYKISYKDRVVLKRNGENVYSGFVSPKWIPDPRSTVKFTYELNSNNYSTSAVGFKTVNMMYFKNLAEAIDYYARGFLAAKKVGE